MKVKIISFCFFLLAVFVTSTAANSLSSIADGVSQALAKYRASHLSEISYNLSFNIPEEKKKSVTFDEQIVFNCPSPLSSTGRKEMSSLKTNTTLFLVAICETDGMSSESAASVGTRH